MQYTTEQVLNLIQQSRERIDPRELTNRDPREVYKDKNIKILNDFSRLSEESNGTCATHAFGEEVSPEGLEGQGQGVMSSAAATTSSRVFSGITAQHHRTNKGIKVSVTLQKADEAEFCAYIELTAELKRSDRIRELKAYEYDSEDFAEFYHALKESVRTNPNREHMCIGRLHQRGSRSAWVADMAVVGTLNADNVVEQIKFYHDDDYAIEMTQQLTRRQVDLYHSSGLFGNLQRQRQAPTLASLKRKHFA